MTSETAEIEDRLLSELHESGEEELVTLLNHAYPLNSGKPHRAGIFG